ncbi:hypothetical protein MINTM019_24240 [Mycobacterium paraintracellulare]|nr:hypothetical protein MINTM001_27040 [Mycobacterium paraintracellulare]BCO89224.1 hypothetical protein MINTM015_24810 [Mycobacterium paraintracellulare]BCP04968.1 hypothetical protein MINTM019_24240 [Mycobacterium paraintracellulare]BCP10328.1 hypothetical protein MINTM020_24260 [Mycobacterium paraintracellulare]
MTQETHKGLARAAQIVSARGRWGRKGVAASIRARGRPPGTDKRRGQVGLLAPRRLGAAGSAWICGTTASEVR